MNKRSSSYSLGKQDGRWPSWDQELLLRAVLLQGQGSVDAWKKWKQEIDLDKVEFTSYRLLSQLYKALFQKNIQDPLLLKLKGIYRLNWSKNQILFRAMSGLLKDLNAAGIKTMILKGAAVTVLYYKDYGLRSMRDFDVLVPAEQIHEAVQVLTRLGWTPVKRPLQRIDDDYFCSDHAHGFRDRDGNEFDIHWYSMLYRSNESMDQEFWSRAVSVEVDGVPTLALDPTDQLLHVCMHGAIRSQPRQLEWICDAVKIHEAVFSEIDWERLYTTVRRYSLELPLHATLCYLHEGLDFPVPEKILEALSKAAISRRDISRYKQMINSPWLPYYISRYRDFLYHKGSVGFLERIMGFPKFLQIIWNLDHVWQVPSYILSKAAARVMGTGQNNAG